MMIARLPILLGNTQYAPGDRLPPVPEGLRTAWIESGAAAERGEGEEEKKPKAGAVAAPAGVSGAAYPASGEPDLVGRVPGGKARGAVKETAKRAPKRKG